jgi:hypothetical protein
MAKSIKPMWTVYGPGGMRAQFDERTHAEDLARQSASESVGSTYYLLGAVAAFVADPPVVRTFDLQGSFAPPPAPEPEDIIDYMEAKAAAEAASPPADGWITWTGGDNPAPGKIVQYRLAGMEQDAREWEADRLRWDWRYGVGGPDITAYRVVRS